MARRFYWPEVTAEQPFIHLFCHTPVEDGKVRAWHTLLMKVRGETATDADHALFDNVYQVSQLNFEQDLQIFRRKKPCLRPVQIPGDPPFRQYRIWYSQFYQPRNQTEAIQLRANGVFETAGVHDAPWLQSTL